jgi:isopentenyl diphosphate isomerase/L-lactate dehydrogenase-like FMN-dependent dehydrogenase
VAAPVEPLNVADYERLASEALDPGALGYFAGGAGDELALRENVAAFRRLRLRPRVLVDVAEVSTRTTVLGEPVAMPILVAPVAFQRLAHPDGEAGMARAAAGAGTVMCLSTLATARPGEVAEAAPDARLWFQLYCFRDRGVTRALLSEAAEAGFRAVALTVDAPRPGRRERDLRSGFQLPPKLGVPSVADLPGAHAPISVADVLRLVDPGLSWTDLEALVADSSLPVLVKGVMTAEDAVLAADRGAAGVIVSNHGGRQLDRVAATVDVVGEVAEAVGDRIEVLMDGGVRRGTDVVAALALGARAVLVGRPPVWGLAVAGADGARRVLDLLRDELELALALCGCPAPDSVSRAHVQRA